MKQYLEKTVIIDWGNPEIRDLAEKLSFGCGSQTEIARNCFEWVRDHVRHSWDYRLNPVTCKASEVLLHRTGYCFAKSHLLAALLRANGIPAGFCYQRILLDEDGPRYSLHGLNAVHLPEFGWYRIDARGNKEGVGARFTPPVETLAFSLSEKGEADFPKIRPSPLPMVVSCLQKHRTYLEVYENLPDVDVRMDTI
jgi:transglutaminase-like putative cysteine protease